MQVFQAVSFILLGPSYRQWMSVRPSVCLSALLLPATESVNSVYFYHAFGFLFCFYTNLEGKLLPPQQMYRALCVRSHVRLSTCALIPIMSVVVTNIWNVNAFNQASIHPSIHSTVFSAKHATFCTLHACNSKQIVLNLFLQVKMSLKEIFSNRNCKKLTRQETNFDWI